jgi:hypothetical protein
LTCEIMRESYAHQIGCHGNKKSSQNSFLQFL